MSDVSQNVHNQTIDECLSKVIETIELLSLNLEIVHSQIDLINQRVDLLHERVNLRKV